MKLKDTNTGYDWKSAKDEEKDTYASKLSEKLIKQNPEATKDFILDALNAFFDSKEKFILENKIGVMAKMASAVNKRLQ